MSNATINRLLWTPESMTLVGWGDKRHLESGTALDETTA
jgi:probable phosphoglycerate mutase